MKNTDIWMRVASLGVLLALTAACPSGGPTASQQEGTVVGPQGGTVTSADGRAQLVVPPGALAQDVAITVGPAPNAPPAALILATFDFGPDGTQFAIPATLRRLSGDRRSRLSSG